MNLKMRFLFFALLICAFSASAAEYDEGAIRLVLHGNSGRFSLYSLRGRNNRKIAQPLFFSQDPRTSFLSVLVNERVFRVADNSAFRVHLNETGSNPSLVFESSFLLVTQEFTFVRSDDSAETNGVLVTVTLENRGDRQISAGGRFLLDTTLGDRRRNITFTTNRRTIDSEFFFQRNSGDRFWIDRNNTLSLTGSLFTGSDEDPYAVHFANWKRLNEAPWSLPHEPGRNFNLLPFSVRDSAVAYYFESRPLNRGAKRSFSFYLLSNSETGTLFVESSPQDQIVNMPVQSGQNERREETLRMIRDIMSRLDTLIKSGTATEEEVAALESTLNDLRARYGPQR